jgi:cellulose synthase/poly-beta-1,6-N-acetylglucosamine synthase-like glycosyltransferase
VDGSTDGTEKIVRKYRSQGIELVYSRQHRGKASALNAATQIATGDVVVFVDVRQTIDRKALRELVANFSDESVGAVTGNLFLLDDTGSECRTDLGFYWRYEKAIRSMESDVYSVVGATGAIYAVRRALIPFLPSDTILDDVFIPMSVVLSGRRVVFDSAARAYDMVACCPMAEYGRKVRTLTGNYQLLAKLPGVLIPWRNPVFIQLLSHKVGRLVVPWLLITLLVSNLFLLQQHSYLFIFAAQSGLYCSALAGHLIAMRRRSEPLRIHQASKEAA